TDSTDEPSESVSPSSSAEPTASASDEPSKSTEAKDPKKDEPKQDSPKKDEPLAETGTGSVPLIAVGGALALIGAAVLLLRRSARRHG
ncbi:LPXTG cell wall anchor domain-containing protein, partial [Glutamicibacter soli]